MKEQRNRLGWTQTELARQAGVNRRWISEFEGGKDTAQIGQVLKVLNALQINLSLEMPHQQKSEAGDVNLNELLDS